MKRGRHRLDKRWALRVWEVSGLCICDHEVMQPDNDQIYPVHLSMRGTSRCIIGQCRCVNRPSRDHRYSL